MYWIPKELNKRVGGRCVDKEWKETLSEEEQSRAIEIEDSTWGKLLSENDYKTDVILNDPVTNTPRLYPRETPLIEKLDREVRLLQDYLDKTDGIYFKCQEENLDVNVKYSEVIQKRKQARARINEIEKITGVSYGNFK